MLSFWLGIEYNKKKCIYCLQPLSDINEEIIGDPPSNQLNQINNNLSELSSPSRLKR